MSFLFDNTNYYCFWRIYCTQPSVLPMWNIVIHITYYSWQKLEYNVKPGNSQRSRATKNAVRKTAFHAALFQFRSEGNCIFEKWTKKCSFPQKRSVKLKNCVLGESCLKPVICYATPWWWADVVYFIILCFDPFDIRSMPYAFTKQNWFVIQFVAILMLSFWENGEDFAFTGWRTS